jgi:hypothetical protein
MFRNKPEKVSMKPSVREIGVRGRREIRNRGVEGIGRRRYHNISWERRGKNMMTEERVLRQTDRIYDLVDVVEEDLPPEVKGDQEIIVIDGRIYERIFRPEDRIYDLVDVVEEGRETSFRKGALGEEIRKIAAEMAEKIAREVIPGIAERVIREEIEKLKSVDNLDS